MLGMPLEDPIESRRRGRALVPKVGALRLVPQLRRRARARWIAPDRNRRRAVPKWIVRKSNLAKFTERPDIDVEPSEHPVVGLNAHAHYHARSGSTQRILTCVGAVSRLDSELAPAPYTSAPMQNEQGVEGRLHATSVLTKLSTVRKASFRSRPQLENATQALAHAATATLSRCISLATTAYIASHASFTSAVNRSPRPIACVQLRRAHGLVVVRLHAVRHVPPPERLQRRQQRLKAVQQSDRRADHPHQALAAVRQIRAEQRARRRVGREEVDGEQGRCLRGEAAKPWRTRVT